MYNTKTRKIEVEHQRLIRNEGTSGGFKEVILSEGDEVYANFKIPACSPLCNVFSNGNADDTSAATVMVRFRKQRNLMFRMNDVRVDFFCSSGPGGQSVNTKSAVLTHIPTGLAPVRKNHNTRNDKAFGVLRSRLYEQELAKKQAEDAS
jgi:peptide chain release factor 1